MQSQCAPSVWEWLGPTGVCLQWPWGMCSRSLSTISPILTPSCLLAAPHGSGLAASLTHLLPGYQTKMSFLQPQVSRCDRENQETLEQQNLQRRLRVGIQGHCQGQEAGEARPLWH